MIATNIFHQHITLGMPSWGLHPRQRWQFKATIAMLSGLVGFNLDTPESILHDSDRISISWSLILPTMIALAWGGRYGLVPASITLFTYLYWHNCPNNEHSIIILAGLHAVWLGWVGRASRRRNSGDTSWWQNPGAVLALWPFFVAVIMTIAIQWIPLLRPGPLEPDLGTKTPLWAVGIETSRFLINTAFILLLANLLLQIRPVRKTLGMPPLNCEPYNTKLVMSSIFVAACCWALDAYGACCMTISSSTTWFQEVASPRFDRFISRFMIVATCLGGCIIIVSMLRRRLQLENDLSRSEEYLRITMDSIVEAIIATDASGRIIRMNRVAAQLTGWLPADALGHPLATVFRIRMHAAECHHNSCDISALSVSSLKTITMTESATILSRQGDERRITFSIAPILDSAGASAGTIINIRDVTNEDRIRNAISHRHKLESLGQMAGGMAHDFNNMLTAMMAAAEVLAEHDCDPKRLRLILMIKTAGGRAACLIRNLLSFAHKGNGPRAPLHVHTAMNDAIEMLRHTIDKRIHIDQELNSPRDVIVGQFADLQGVFLNLGVNASHAMPAGGTLRLCSREVSAAPTDLSLRFNLANGPYMEIQVCDTGTGIPPEILPHIFDPFFTTKAAGKGTGLGLTSALETIRDHRGAISVTSTPGTGTIFTILLPIAPTGPSSS